MGRVAGRAEVDRDDEEGGELMTCGGIEGRGSDDQGGRFKRTRTPARVQLPNGGPTPKRSDLDPYIYFSQVVSATTYENVASPARSRGSLGLRAKW